MKVLLVEDSPRLRTSIVSGFQNAGFAVDAAGDGESGLWYARSNTYDVIVLDLMLPGIDGLTLLQRLREQKNTTHVLILSAKDTVEDRVRGLEMGADDYLVKPFSFDELLARVQALVRRNYGVKKSTVAVGDLEIDIAGRIARRAGQIIDLAPREFALLEYLVLRRGEVVSRTDIETHIYDENVEPMSNVVDSAVCALRRRIDLPGQPSLVRTRRGMGYFVAADER
ncbi:MAG: response regulator transcription factor [Phycisphaerae bacterium]|nr:response regulator transcription factor [Phycisphaerae bacterium]